MITDIFLSFLPGFAGEGDRRPTLKKPNPEWPVVEGILASVRYIAIS